MTLTSVRLAGSLQALVDVRLDTIERMLMGRVSRQDRLSIVKDVEAQIFDILAEGGNEEPTREDVLAALTRLDPPEAYLPEEGETFEARPVVERRPMTARTVESRSAKEADPKIGKISGIVGISAVVLSLLSPTSYAIGVFTGSEIVVLTLFFGCMALIFCCGLLGLALAITARFRGVWSIVGGVLSSVVLVFSSLASLGLGYLIVVGI